MKARLYVSASNIPPPGDIRALGRGDEIVISPAAPSHQGWSGFLCALPNAVARGANVRWER